MCGGGGGGRGEGAGFKIFDTIFLFIVRGFLSEFLRMYVELSAALKFLKISCFYFFSSRSLGPDIRYKRGQNRLTLTSG